MAPSHKAIIMAITVIGAIIVVALALISLLLLVEPIIYEVGEQGYYEVSYPTREAASDALSYRLIPPSAIDIRYMGLYQEPETWLYFSFAPEDISDMRKSCNRVVEGEVELHPYGPPGNLFDWPDEIYGTVRGEDFSDYEIYKCEVRRLALYKRFREGVLVVDVKNGKAFYWGP